MKTRKDKIKYDPKRKAPLNIKLINHETGEQLDCPCTSERFLNYDTLQASPIAGFQYNYYSSWILMEKISETVLYHRPYDVIEIGAGESTIVLGKVTERKNIDFHSVDIKPEKRSIMHKNHTYHCMTSKEFMAEYDDNPAIVLIDADHRYAQAKKEFDFFFEKLVPGGIIFLHDTMPPHKEYLRDTACSDVYKLRKELEVQNDIMDCLTFPYTAGYMGLTVIIKKQHEGEAWER